MRPPAEAELLHRILVAEDARAATDAELAPLVEGLASATAEIRRVAVRGLGRLERPELLPRITPLLGDPEATVRAEAANAAAQAVLRADPAGAAADARAALLARLEVEPDDLVRAILAQSVGRVRHASAAEVAATAAAILEQGVPDSSAAAVHVRAPARATKGLLALVRQPAARGAVPDAVVAHLRESLTFSVLGPGEPGDLERRRNRTLAAQALVATGRATVADLETILADEDPLVRREAVAAAAGVGDAAAARRLLGAALEDPSPFVRHDAVRAWARLAEAEGCAPVVEAALDPDAHVALAAIDLLPACPGPAAHADLLDSLVLAVPRPEPGTDWHRAAHALVALATVDAARAIDRMLPFVASEDPFVRAWAARAAAALDEAATLRLLARDDDPNVRVVALDALAELEGREVDGILIEQLDELDPQLVMTAAGLLEGTEDPAALAALLASLERFSARGRETERDARMALLERLEPLGNAASADRLRPLLGDYDPVVAARAADVIAGWTGERPAPEPQAPVTAGVPTPARLDSLAEGTFTVEMAGGGSFELRLRAWDAPTNADRFARLAELGYYDGLTYHRVVPNFVVQGGSPAANEYAGDGPFSRDELGIEGSWRGTVGLSTRGRDTGDGQMFINLIDNVRLDHEYTVFAEVVRGMEVVDRLQEGARITRIRRTAGP